MVSHDHPETLINKLHDSEGTTMATPVDKDCQKLRVNLLQLIRWKNDKGTVQTLRLYTVLSTEWEKVSDLLMLDPHMRISIAEKNNFDHKKCIRDVIEKWMQDEKSLSSNYKCTWNGLCQLLQDLEQSAAASDLRGALGADVSSFNNNIYDEASPKVTRSEKKSYYTSSSRELIKPYEYCKERNFKFPGINLEGLKDEEKEALKNTLNAESHRLAKKFMKIRLSFYSYLEENLIKLMPTIQTHLNEFLMLPPMYGNKQNNKHKTFTSDLTIQDISDFLTRYCSFFNYELLRQIFKGINYQDGLESLKQHDRDLEEYAKKRICHFPSGVGMFSDYVVVAVKLDDMYVDCNIQHLIDFHKELCRILEVTLGQFTLDGLQPGCICIILHLLESLFDIVFPLSDEKEDELKETKCHTAKIISIFCKTFIYKPEDGKKHSDLVKPQPYQPQKKVRQKKQEHHRQEKEKESLYEEDEYICRRKKKESFMETNKDYHSWHPVREEEYPWHPDMEEDHLRPPEEGAHQWHKKEKEHNRHQDEGEYKRNPYQKDYSSSGAKLI